MASQKEYHAIGVQTICRDLGWESKLRVHSDAAAAIRIARRRGWGKIRHLDVEGLWVQAMVGEKVVDLVKEPGSDIPADCLTKYVDRAKLTKMLKLSGMRVMEGRSGAAQNYRQIPP